MGAYLSNPKTDINTSEGENDRFVYCTADMQGWRISQEDSHVVMLNYDKGGSSFFAVFDGHGGAEVSQYCSLNLPDFIKNSNLFQQGEITEALEESFLKFDSTLKEPHVINELKKLASGDGDFLEDIEDDEAIMLKKDAQLPLDEIISNGNYEPSLCTEKKNGESSKDDLDIKSNVETNSNDHDNENHKEENKNHVDTKIDSDNCNGKQQNDVSDASSSQNFLASAFKKAITKGLYEAFLQDYNSEDDDEEESEESHNSSSGSGSDVDDEEGEEEEDEDEDDCDDGQNSGTKEIMAFRGDSPGKDSGCTAIVTYVRNNTFYVANVGDSRCVLSRNGTAVEMSEDHKPEDPIEKNRIQKAGGKITEDGRVNSGLNLSRALGDHAYKKNTELSDREQMITALPDVRTFEIDPEKDDFFILACDGIWNSLDSQQVVDFVKERMNKEKSLKTICQELFYECLAPNTEGDGSGCDNMTCILVKIKNLNSTTAKRQLDDSTEPDTSLNDHSESSSTKKVKPTAEEDMFKPGTSKV